MATPEDQVYVEESEPTAPRRQVTGAQLALVGGGILVLLGLVWLLFLRGGGEETTAAPPAPPPATAPAPDVDGDGGGGGGDRPGRGPVETFEVFAPKDPFDPLITADSGGDGTTTDDGTADDGDGSTTTDDGTGTDTDGDGTIDTTGDTGDPTTTGGTDGTSSETVSGHSVQLVATLEGGRIQVQVDDAVYTVDEGERFAQNFELVSVSGECATLLYGDDQFTLCEGEEILK